MLVLFLFVSTTFVFQVLGERKLLRCQVGRKFSFPLVCPGHNLAPRPVHLRAPLHQGVSSGFLGILCFGLVAVCFCLFLLLGLVAVFLFLGFGVFWGRAISRCFSFLRFFLGFPASCCVVLLHLASFSLRLGQEHSPVRPAAMDPDPPPAVHWRVPGHPSPAGSRPWNTPVHSWRGCGIHCDPLHDHHCCHLSPR